MNLGIIAKSAARPKNSDLGHNRASAAPTTALRTTKSPFSPASTAPRPDRESVGGMDGAVVVDLADARRRAEHRERWRNQRAAAGLLQGERVADCQRSLTRLGISIERNTVTGRAEYAGVLTCDNCWACPICAGKLTEHKRRELQDGMNLWTRDGGKVYLLTLTFRHDVTLSIDEGIGKMQRALRSLKGSRAYKQIMAAAGAIGAVKALEVTCGENGWHPHTHTLIFARAGRGDHLEKIRELWADAVRRVGLGTVNEHGFDLRGGDYAAEYVAKFGKEAGDQSRATARAWWSASHELTKGHTKQTQRLKGATPFTLLRWYRGGDAHAGAMFIEYAHAFKGRAQLYWSPRLRKKLDLLELQRPKLPAPEREKVAAITRDDWRAVLRNDARWELLYVAERYGADAVEYLLGELRRSRGRWRDSFNAPPGALGVMIEPYRLAA